MCCCMSFFFSLSLSRYIFSPHPLYLAFRLYVLRFYTLQLLFFFFCINETLASTRPLGQDNPGRRRHLILSFSPKGRAPLPASDRRRANWARSQRHVTAMADISRSLV